MSDPNEFNRATDLKEDYCEDDDHDFYNEYDYFEENEDDGDPTRYDVDPTLYDFGVHDD